MGEAVKRGFPEGEIGDAAFRYQREVESGMRKIVGVNSYTEGHGDDTPILKIDPALEDQQVQRVRAVRGARDEQAAPAALHALELAAPDEHENLMPHLLDGARAHATEREMIEALQRVLG